jgi:FkbM family methyltransferase
MSKLAGLRLLYGLRALRGILTGKGPDDVTLIHRVLREGPPGRVMLDVGAHYGNSLAPFAFDGWQVHAFEPDPANRARLRARWASVPGVTIDPRALSDGAVESAPFFRSAASTGISTLSPFDPSHQEAEPVTVTTVEAYLDERHLTNVDFLKVDTEGHDLFVLKGMPWDRVRPKAVLCEFDDAKTRPLGYGYHGLASYLQERGYRIVVSEWYPLAEYGRGHTWRRYAEYPVELDDSRGWGNLLALREGDAFERLIAQTGLA